MMRLIMTAALAAFASAQCDLTPGTDCSSDTCTYTALVGTAATSDSCDSSTTTTVTTCTGTSTPTIVDETCLDTVEGEVVADCATGYTAGTVDAPSTTCPTGCTQVDATSTAGATCDLTTGSCPAGCDSADAATFVAAADASTDYVAEACTVTPVETTTTTAASTPPASGASAVTVGALTICATVAALL